MRKRQKKKLAKRRAKFLRERLLTAMGLAVRLLRVGLTPADFVKGGK